MPELRQQVPKGLDLPEGCGVTRAEERFHKLGWLAFAAIVLAALAGLLGPGPLSSRTADAGPALSVGYDRFTRFHAPARLELKVRAHGTIRVHLGREFLEAAQLDSIQPEPASVEAGAAGHVYAFDAPRLGGAQTAIVFHYRPDETLRSIPIRVRLEGGPALSVSQFVYP